MFSSEIFESFKNTYFEEHLRAIAPVSSFPNFIAVIQVEKEIHKLSMAGRFSKKLMTVHTNFNFWRNKCIFRTT